MSRLWLLDFDRTLFRSDDHSEALLQTAIQHGLIARERVPHLRSKMFNAENTVDTSALFVEEGMQPEKVFELLADTPETFLYDDARLFLDRLDAFHVVTTASNVAEQHAKLRLAGLDDTATVLDGLVKGEYIRDHLVQRGEGWVFPDYDSNTVFDEVMVVDDRFAMIEILYELPRVNLVLLQRPDAKYVYSDTQYPRLNIVTRLKDIQLI